MSTTEWSWSFRNKAILLKKSVSSCSGLSSNREPVPHAVLVDADLSGNSLAFNRGPNSQLLQMTTIKLLINWLSYKPPIPRSFAALIEQLNTHPHYFD